MLGRLGALSALVILTASCSSDDDSGAAVPRFRACAHYATLFKTSVRSFHASDASAARTTVVGIEINPGIGTLSFDGATVKLEGAAKLLDARTNPQIVEVDVDTTTEPSFGLVVTSPATCTTPDRGPTIDTKLAIELDRDTGEPTSITGAVGAQTPPDAVPVR